MLALLAGNAAFLAGVLFEVVASDALVSLTSERTSTNGQHGACSSLILIGWQHVERMEGVSGWRENSKQGQRSNTAVTVKRGRDIK